MRITAMKDDELSVRPHDMNTIFEGFKRKRTKFSNIIDDINSSPDPYAKLRSYYIQNRRKNLLVSEDYENILIEKEEEEFEKLLD